MRRVLLVSFFYPPSNVVGAIRVAKLARYLPAHGWEPTVLTVDRFRSRPATLALEEPAPRILRARFVDPVGALLARRREGGRPAPSATAAPASGSTLKQVLGPLARHLPGVSTMHVPDRAAPWFGPAVLAGRRALSELRFDALWSTSPPPTAHLVGATLAALSGVGWVADYRDLWSGNPSTALGPLRRGFERLLERRVLSGARALVTVSEPVAQRLTALHGRRARVITNGFDPAETPGPDLPPEPRLTLTYTGSIYPARQDPAPLLEGIALLRDRDGLTPDDLRVRFFGSEHEALPPLLARYDVADFVRLHGLVDRAEAVARQRVADALVVLDWNAPTEQGVLTLKGLEYLQARRPILIVGQRRDTSLARLLTEAGVGHCSATAADVAETLAAWLAERRATGRVAYAGRRSVIADYSWERLAGRLAEVLEEVAEGG